MNLVDVWVGLCCLVGIASAVVVAFHPNILYAAVSLVFSLLSVAGLYGALGADFLAGVQLMIYVGGIIVVILFAVMMSENIYRTRFLDTAKRYTVPMILSVPFVVALLALVNKTPWGAVDKPELLPVTAWMGHALVGPYALVFEYVAIVLLFGLIGAVVVARPHHGEESDKKKGEGN